MAQETNYDEKLGAKLSEFRKKKGMTQEQVANEIRMQRSSYALVEAGKRHLGSYELFNASVVLDFSIVDVMNEIMGSSITSGNMVVKYEKRRMFNYQKFKNVFLYILHECREKENVGKVVLNKLLYYADFNYYEKHRDYLTGLRYSKLPKGPVPGIEEFVKQMWAYGELKVTEEEVGNYVRTRYIPTVKADMSLISKAELEIINDVISQYGHLSAKEISNLSHDDPPWLETPNIGDEIDYNLVFKRKKTI